MQLNTQQWQWFEFDRIFDMKKGFYNKKPEPSANGTIPFIGATDKNNGITGYYTLDDIKSSSKTGKGKNESLSKKLFPANAVCVTNNGSVGFAYYQATQFTCSHDVNPLYKKNGEFNPYTGLFIASVIMKDRYRWGYGRKWRPARMIHSKIKLPILLSKSGEPYIDMEHKYSDLGYVPDWEYMESYIKSLNFAIPKTKNTGAGLPELDVSSWKKFYLHELFKTENGNGIDAVATSNEAPKYNYVSRNRNNNGVVAFVDEVPDKVPFPSGCMTLALGGSYLGCCYVQNKPFYTAQNVGVLTPKTPMTTATKLFIATIIRSECRTKFKAFGRELNSHFRSDFALKLPVKRENGNPIIDPLCKYSTNGYIPDWKLMNDYISKLPYGDQISSALD